MSAKSNMELHKIGCGKKQYHKNDKNGSFRFFYGMFHSSENHINEYQLRWSFNIGNMTYLQISFIVLFGPDGNCIGY